MWHFLRHCTHLSGAEIKDCVSAMFSDVQNFFDMMAKIGQTEFNRCLITGSIYSFVLTMSEVSSFTTATDTTVTGAKCFATRGIE